MREFIGLFPALGWVVLVTFVASVIGDPLADPLLADDDDDAPTINFEASYRLPMEEIRMRRASEAYLGPAGYYPCAAPEGYRGTCKPRATCASYYSTTSHYDPQRPEKYKSCTFGYGYRGVCCPDVTYTGTGKFRRRGRCLWCHGARKPNVIKIPPQKRLGYNPKYSEVNPAAIQECIAYASVQIKGPFENDTDLGRGEEDDSYWGNGVVVETYLAELHKIGWASYFIVLVTYCLKDKYGYNPAAAYDGGLELSKYMNYLPKDVQDVCSSLNIQKCSKSKYRTIDGTCNNLIHPTWGAARTSVQNLVVPTYPDGIWAIKRAKSGHLLPQARYLRSVALPEKDVADPHVNLYHTYFGQFIAHDTSHVYFYQTQDGSFIDCCHGYKQRPHQVSPKCYAIELPRNDPFYSTVQQTCLNLARLSLAPHDNCAAGYAIQSNRQTAHLDLSVVYGTHKAETDKLRNFEYGLLKMSKVGDQYYLPLDANAECFNTSKGFCFRAGDLRNTIHPGITSLQTIYVRFHNYCAKKLYYLNPQWNDEKIFQECRRINIAIFQHIIYTEYLPLQLGWNVLYEHGILPATEGYSYDYNEYTNPAILTEFSGAVFRHHSAIYGHINIMDENYKVISTEMLANTYNNPSIFKNPDNFDGIIRGYLHTPQRLVDKYYDHQVSLYMLRDQRRFGLDMGAINIERGRDYGFQGYNYYRELCGLKRATTWEDFYDWIPQEDVHILRQQYQHVDDVELYPAGLMEKHQPDSLVGPTWWCIAAQQFKNWKAGDRYFYDRGGPYAFTLPQLDQIRQMSLASFLCITTGLKQVPAFAFRPVSEANPLYQCSDYEAIPRIDFGPWKSKPKPKAYKRAPQFHYH